MDSRKINAKCENPVKNILQSCIIHYEGLEKCLIFINLIKNIILKLTITIIIIIKLIISRNLV